MICDFSRSHKRGDSTHDDIISKKPTSYTSEQHDQHERELHCGASHPRAQVSQCGGRDSEVGLCLGFEGGGRHRWSPNVNLSVFVTIAERSLRGKHTRI